LSEIVIGEVAVTEEATGPVLTLVPASIVSRLADEKFPSAEKSTLAV
jgi:hypothetical protein